MHKLPLAPLALLAVLGAARVANAQTHMHRLDDAQPRVLLRFLQTVADGRDAGPLIDTVMASPGTALVIAQQNLMRRVSAAEYREVLQAVAEHREPKLVFDASDPRALKGADGLLRDVLPMLRWGSAHVDALTAKVSELAALDVEALARARALENLPEPVALDVRLYLVMGGRAGAAASDSAIYFDVLATAARYQDRFPPPAGVVDYYAHELHHVGLRRLLARREKALQLDTAGGRALSLLEGVVMEGSASYLVSGHRDLEGMRRDPAYTDAGSDSTRMQAVERVLTGVLEGAWSGAAYDEAMAGFTGNKLHMTGAAMLDAIWRARGREGVMAVMSDPRLLLLRYDESLPAGASAYRFPAALAQRVAALGS